MKRGFTLIELIFVIVIIGVLAAVAVPKFTGLKGSAVAANAIKVGVDGYTSVPSAYANLHDLQSKDVTLTGTNALVQINGKGWNTSDNNLSKFNNGGAGDAVTVRLTSDIVELNITCNNFKETQEKDYCNDQNYSASQTISLN